MPEEHMSIRSNSLEIILRTCIRALIKNNGFPKIAELDIR